jgi:hypothetical protein
VINIGLGEDINLVIAFISVLNVPVLSPGLVGVVVLAARIWEVAPLSLCTRANT